MFNSATFVNSKEWLISPDGSYSISASALSSTGFVNSYNDVYGYPFAVRPTFYLNSSILKIVGGTGTSTDPYHIE